ncbi:MAG: hypothetical protein JWO30_1639 [Fibrobacteres bacterium]|nr:hypothetical protein [Fibrobacterota bacterium]
MRNNFPASLPIMAAMILCGLPLAAWSDPVDTAAVKDSVSARPDSATSLSAGPLLPEVLSPGEHIMWGEHGLMRITGIFPLTEESRERELGLRRAMLTVHEVAGFATLAAMLATVTYGQLTLNGYTSLGGTHQTLAAVTIGSYFFTAAMSLLSPPPMVRRKEWNTVSIHKGLAIIHFSGMILTPLLANGVAMKERGSGTSQTTIDRDKAHIHQISGYITTVAFAGAMMAVTF